MNKGLKITLIVIASIFLLFVIVGAIVIVATGNTANATEYKLGNDTVKSIKAVVEKRKVYSVSKEKNKGDITKVIGYKSDSFQDDLIKYTQYLTKEGGFTLTKDMDLEVVPSTVELAKTSVDSGKVVTMMIEYDSKGYTITIKKYEGTLQLY